MRQKCCRENPFWFLPCFRRPPFRNFVQASSFERTATNDCKIIQDASRRWRLRSAICSPQDSRNKSVRHHTGRIRSLRSLPRPNPAAFSSSLTKGIDPVLIPDPEFHGPVAQSTPPSISSARPSPHSTRPPTLPTSPAVPHMRRGLWVE
jgi:hypothetical protein